MRIDTPYIIELCRGVEKRTLEPGDTELNVPATLLPVISLLSPSQIGIGNNVAAQNSAAASFSITRTNLGGLTSGILVLPPGVWTLQLWMTSRFNYVTSGVATPDALVRLINVPNTFTFFLLGHYATVGSKTEYASYDFLFQEQQSVQVILGATGVADVVDMTVGVNAVRRI